MYKLFSLLILTVSSDTVFANSDSEIAHLLTYIETSSCVFERNGDTHSAAEAAEHITTKYRYYEDDIESSEDFIKLAATKSSLSGRRYFIQCPKQRRIATAEWLTVELNRYRNNKLTAE